MSEEKQKRWCYVARLLKANAHHQANTVVCAACDDGKDDRTAQAVAEWIKDGLAVERVPLGWARTYLFTQQPYPSAYPAEADA